MNPDFSNIRRENAEYAILHHMKEIVKICREYAPDDPYISLCWLHDRIMANNSEKSPENTIDFSYDDDGGLYSFEWHPRKSETNDPD